MRRIYWILAALLCVGSFSILLNRFTSFQTGLWPWGLIFLFIAGFAQQIVVDKKTGKELASALLAFIVIRLLAALVLLLVMSLLVHGEFMPFAIHFIVQYGIFSIFEIAFTSRKFKQRKP